MGSSKRSRTSDRVGRLWPLAVALLAGCGTADGLAPLRVGPPPPPGTPAVTEAVDGLTVGHRLMAAGEPELALEAYLRAAGEHGMTADVLAALGSANLRLGRLGQAETQLRQATDKDERFVAAWNNLGVVLMERGAPGEARRVFRTAYALDSGRSREIRDNLRLALAKTPEVVYKQGQGKNTDLKRRGGGRYRLLSAK